jgi:hypothetical protein
MTELSNDETRRWEETEEKITHYCGPNLAPVAAGYPFRFPVFEAV